VAQLSDGDSHQVWDVAVRLTRSGLARQPVLEQLGRAWKKHGLSERVDLEAGRLDDGPAAQALLTALARLGR